MENSVIIQAHVASIRAKNLGFKKTAAALDKIMLEMIDEEAKYQRQLSQRLFEKKRQALLGD